MLLLTCPAYVTHSKPPILNIGEQAQSTGGALRSVISCKVLFSAVATFLLRVPSAPLRTGSIVACDTPVTVHFVWQNNSTNNKQKTGVQGQVAAAEARPVEKYTNASGFAAFLHQRLGQLLSTIQVNPALPLHFILHHV